MAASTIPKSGGPGSSVELSPVTIAVRDKVIEKFADQPLDEMNNSVKNLLNHEEDEQKRLGILAARVYILRQRIANIAGGEQERVITSASPKADDLMPTDTDATDGAIEHVLVACRTAEQRPFSLEFGQCKHVPVIA